MKWCSGAGQFESNMKCSNTLNQKPCYDRNSTVSKWPNRTHSTKNVVNGKPMPARWRSCLLLLLLLGFRLWQHEMMLRGRLNVQLNVFIVRGRMRQNVFAEVAGTFELLAALGTGGDGILNSRQGEFNKLLLTNYSNFRNFQYLHQQQQNPPIM